MNVADLVAFEQEVATAFSAGHIHAPVHLSGGNEEQLLGIFQEVMLEDWVLSTWRSHYHALLKGVPRDLVMADILAGKSMMLHYPEYNFMSSALVGGMLPIACGLAAGGKRVWCFVGDMCARAGAFYEARTYMAGQDLSRWLTFVIEDNGLSTNTPTQDTWRVTAWPKLNVRKYTYKRKWPHYQPLPNQRGF